MKQLSHIISTIFQPLMMPIYGVALLFVYTYFRLIYINLFWTIMAPALLFSFALPACCIYVFYKFGIVSDLSLTKRKERFMPYLFTLISYAAMLYFYYQLGMPRWFLMQISASLAIMAIAILITVWWKISAHMIGIGGLLGGAMAVSYFIEKTNPYYLFMSLFVLAGMIGTSRLILRRHTLGQVIAGFGSGTVVSFLFVWWGIL